MAQAQNGTAELTWRVANEQNMSVYEIEKSADSKTFTPLSKINAKNGQSQTYNALDEKPFAGVSYYRLKMVDLDGHVTYSAIKSVVFEEITSRDLHHMW